MHKVNFAKRFDKAYEYGRRVFVEDALLHGAYSIPAPAAVFADGSSLPAITFDMVAPQDGPKYVPQIAAREALNDAFRAANGFCDPYVDPGDFGSDFNLDFGG